MNKYIYFISYTFKDDYDYGSGNCSFGTNKKISNYDYILSAADDISKYNDCETISIVYYKLIETNLFLFYFTQIKQKMNDLKNSIKKSLIDFINK